MERGGEMLICATLSSNFLAVKFMWKTVLNELRKILFVEEKFW